MKLDSKRAFETMRGRALKAIRKGRFAEAEHWTKLAERHVALDDKATKLTKLKLANDAQKILNDREARFERERRIRGY